MNLAHYGTSAPPEYDLTQVRCPTFLFAGDADGFATPDDVTLLESRLTAVASKKTFIVPKTNWAHLYFILSIDAGQLVYKPILAIMEDFSKGDSGFQ